jgi:hypothetical protein
MTKIGIDMWILIIGVAVPCLGLSFIALVTRRRRGKASEKDGQKRPTMPAFTQNLDQEMVHQLVCQKTETLFNSLFQTLHNQRERLMGTLSLGGQVLSSPTPLEQPNLKPFRLENREIAAQGMAPGTPVLPDPYESIPDLLGTGLSVEEVAEKLGLPRSEVRLFVKLRLGPLQGEGEKEGEQTTPMAV